MHDPQTVAFEIRYPWKRDGYNPSFITIWHVDPEADGTDDSCGWFMRSRHGDPAQLKRIEKDFEFEWCKSWGGWFNEDGSPRLSVIAITIGMFQIAAYAQLKSWPKGHRFIRKHFVEIVHFAENNIDSLHPSITGRYGIPPQADRIHDIAVIVYGCVLRWTRPWYLHPRWHVHHWKIQFHPWQNLRRRFWDKCSKCGKRGFPPGVSACGNWSGTEIWHSTCDGTRAAVVAQ